MVGLALGAAASSWLEYRLLSQALAWRIGRSHLGGRWLNPISAGCIGLGVVAFLTELGLRRPPRDHLRRPHPRARGGDLHGHHVLARRARVHLAGRARRRHPQAQALGRLTAGLGLRGVSGRIGGVTCRHAEVVPTLVGLPHGQGGRHRSTSGPTPRSSWSRPSPRRRSSSGASRNRPPTSSPTRSRPRSGSTARWASSRRSAPTPARPC